MCAREREGEEEMMGGRERDDASWHVLCAHRAWQVCVRERESEREGGRERGRDREREKGRGGGERGGKEMEGGTEKASEIYDSQTSAVFLWRM